MKQLIVIPCYNTHIYINKLISNIYKNTSTDILVIDDGSSPKISFEKDKVTNLKIIRNDTNKGKGHALKKGFLYAKENNYSHVITLDGDLQHDPFEINKFILEDKDIDFLIGYRELRRPMPLSRIISNTITSKIISLILNKNIRDSQCGYRRYRLKKIDFNSNSSNGYIFESEILLKSVNKLSILKNIPIKVIYDGSPSHINKFTDTIKFIKLILKHIIA